MIRGGFFFYKSFKKQRAEVLKNHRTGTRHAPAGVALVADRGGMSVIHADRDRCEERARTLVTLTRRARV
jgi:hypothetical protein